MTESWDQFFKCPTTDLAKKLLGKWLLYDGPDGLCGGLIVDCEAYLGVDDPASHAAGGRRTQFTESLYGQAGNAYIYENRGRTCLDIVAGKVGDPQGILIRGLEPFIGAQIMAKHRGMASVDVSNGPAKLMAALGVNDRSLDGHSLRTGSLRLQLDNGRTPAKVIQTTRIGINPQLATAKLPNRFYVAGNPYVTGIKIKDEDPKNHGWEE